MREQGATGRGVQEGRHVIFDAAGRLAFITGIASVILMVGAVTCPVAAGEFDSQGITGSVRIGKAQPKGSVWTRPFRRAAAGVKRALTIEPRVTPADDPVKLSSSGPREVGPDLFLSAAVMQQRRGNLSAAISAYQEVLARDKHHRMALLGLARCQQMTKKPNEAIATYRTLLSRNGEDAVAWNDLGLCYAREEQPTQAIHALKNAVNASPTSVLYRNNLATVLVDVGRMEEALTELQAAHGPSVGHFNLAYMLQQRGDSARALHHAEQAMRLDPSFQPANTLYHSLLPAGSEQRSGRETNLPSVEQAVEPVVWLSSESGVPDSIGDHAVASVVTPPVAPLPGTPVSEMPHRVIELPSLKEPPRLLGVMRFPERLRGDTSARPGLTPPWPAE